MAETKRRRIKIAKLGSASKTCSHLPLLHLFLLQLCSHFSSSFKYLNRVYSLDSEAKWADDFSTELAMMKMLVLNQILNQSHGDTALSPSTT